MKWPLMPNTVNFWDRLAVAKFVLTSDRLTNGPKVREFEHAWNAWLDSNHSLMVSSGSTANFLLLASVKELYNLTPGAKVLLPACTWVTNVAPVIQLGFTPIFCDINLDNFSFDPEHMGLIAQAHPDIELVFVTHLLGFPAPTDQINKLWPHALILDDVCESHGAQLDTGTKVGANSLGATYSFYWGHHITTVEGGMISTHDPELYELMKIKRSHGLAREGGNVSAYAAQYPDIDPQFLFLTDGYNFRSTEINAVLGLRQMQGLDAAVKARRDNYAAFVSLINSEFPNKFHTLHENVGNSSFCLPLLCKDPDTLVILKRVLTLNGVEHRPIVGGNLLRQPFLKNYQFDVTLPRDVCNADILNTCGCYIGNNHFVTVKQVKALVNILDNV